MESTNGTLVNMTALSRVFVTRADFDDLILLLWATIVFFMQGGFAMLEAGAVQRSLKLNILFKNMIDASIIALLFWGVGYGLAFGEPSNAFSGLGEFFLIGTPSRRYAYVFFQYSFTTTTATILSGGAAGRLRIGGYMIYCVFMGAIMHPLVIHWIWASSGWLNAYGRNAFLGVGLADFAGGVAVHVNGGAATLVAVWLGGYRNQQSNDPANPPRYEPIGNGKWRSNVLPADSVSESTYGVFILWFGFFAFNMGSFVTFAGRGDLVGLVGINSALCSAGAALGTVFFSQILQRIRVRAGRLAKVNPWQMDDVLNGTLVGLVAATSNCSLVNTWAAVVIGIFAGIVYVLLTMFMEACRLDDPVQAVAVHLGGGGCASIGSALFATPELLQRVYSLPQLPTEYGLFLGGGWKHLANTVVGVLSVSVFTGVITFAVLGSLYWIDHRFSLHWFFMRSSYETEQVTFMEEAAERGLSGLGIADVTKQNMEAETERDHIIMFAETPRAPRSAAESPDGRLKKVERARKRFERIRRKQIKKSRPSNAPATPPPLLHEQEQDEGNAYPMEGGASTPDYDVKEMSPSFDKVAVEL